MREGEARQVIAQRRENATLAPDTDTAIQPCRASLALQSASRRIDSTLMLANSPALPPEALY
ncbi:hypothetical protein BURKHO8Y_170441 [Burkholderia sp. 8Y]|nr:hypothetical protein BURKHO8Y_170441 [Burkholderia sp. 8Y]